MNDTSKALSEKSTEESVRPAIRELFRLRFESAQDAFVLLYPEGMVKLNQSAAEIIRRCDGKREVHEIVAELESAFNRGGLAQPGNEFLPELTARDCVEWR
jgi:pyrroloquinoline quinone biosynthesis protein D